MKALTLKKNESAIMTGEAWMTGRGGLPLIVALILFLLFFANVSAGAAGGGAPLGDVAEMVLLLASAILFVIGVLMREAAVHDDASKD